MKAALLRFVALLLPLLIITTTITLYIYKEDIQQLEQGIKDREMSLQRSSLNMTQLHFRPVVNDLQLLSLNLKALNIATNLTDQQAQAITREFINVMKTRSDYDQLRLINSQGKEVIRVDNDEGITNVIPPSLLQDKSHRPYVQHSLALPPDSLYTSQFDLNIENGELELPKKPVLRFITRIEANNSTWLISINYLGQYYLDNLQHEYKWKNSSRWLVNGDGNWLQGPDEARSWMYMDSENNANDFHNQYPELWREINTHQEGQFEKNGNLYTYSRFFSDKNQQASDLYKLPFGGTDLPWTVISKINLNTAVTSISFTPDRIIKFALSALLILGLLSGCMVMAWHLARRLQQERELKQRSEDLARQYETLVKNTPNGLITLNFNRKITNINPAAAQIFQVVASDVINQPISSLKLGVNAKYQINKIIDEIKQSAELGSRQSIKSQIKLTNATLKKQHLEIIGLQTQYSDHKEILLAIRDVTSWVTRELKLKSLSRALEQSNDTVVITDCRGIIEYVNHSFETVAGVRAKELIGTQSEPLLKEALGSDPEVRNIQLRLKSGQTVHHVVSREHDNSTLYEEKTISPIRNERGKISHYISTGKDITERVLFESKLHKLAHYDALTSLPNRTLFYQQLESVEHQAKVTNKPMALLHLDIDFFKQVNDSLGYDLSDQVLVIIAKRIRSTLRDHDILARLDGDEFSILMKNGVDAENVALLANRLLQTISSLISINSQELWLSASIGIALYPTDATDHDGLIKCADIALSRAKLDGRNQATFFNEQMAIDSNKLLNLESELRKTLGTSRYKLYYQPKVRTGSHELCGIEALLRWTDDRGNIQPPNEVIPILESSGLIIDVGEHLIYQSCLQLKKWQDQGHFINYALNISARQLLNSNIVETMHKAITVTGCDPQYLEIEITESVVMSDVKTAFDKLVKLQALGVRIAIDDFGTGYSSLAYLTRFPIHILKVDREFVKELPMNKDSITITRSIIELAHNLHLNVVAEGVENIDQIKFLETIGVEEFQGYYFGKPMPLEEFERTCLPTKDDSDETQEEGYIVSENH
ncbi:diguanylate phosphodiesterase [Photobacterium jeanii]|uniref:Diguanylate phosphodiesterase n=1 Tax=Photobacterium jeanii TaxID=858640 RepID=A0A178KK93_9GAMM|nr:EAL domain-containing protein [Photobacterium jeanii]OAN17677.1 diguanylate phosphodiesterase [Photobacterium jeanii]PST92666.1 PAS domain S-box protein [Photobacterium jeanii]